MNTNPMNEAASGALRPAARASTSRLRLSVTSAGVTDKGRQRETNQDRFLVAALTEARGGGAPQGWLLAVADGVGGSHGGDVASTLAIDSTERLSLPALRTLAQAQAPERALILEELRGLVRYADKEIAAEARRSPAYSKMATTLTAAAILGSTLYFAHVGDSRCYVLRNGVLRRITEDDTMTAELVRRGLLTPEAAANHHHRHVLINFVGGGTPGLQVATGEVALAAGDTVLLCSDGLHDMVPEIEIAGFLAAAETPGAACERLVARANVLGGEDNVTAVVARCVLAA